MKNNEGTVTISLERYNKLLEFEKELFEEKIHTVIIYDRYGLDCKILTNDDAMNRTALELKNTKDLLSKWENYPKEINKIFRDMSIWKFLKWRNGYNDIRL